MPMTPPSPISVRRTVVALNLASALAQIGQYGIGFVVLPVWLAARGLGPFALGVLGALQWFGMLLGIRLAPWLVARVGARRGVVAGLALGVAGFALLVHAPGRGWAPAAALLGVGLGLRWIALEPWLYALVAPHRRGRIVGVHETLIALAPIVAPAAAAALGMHGTWLLGLGAGASLLALAPLALAGASAPAPRAERGGPIGLRALRLAIVIVVGGGVVEGAFTVLVPLLGQAWQLAPQRVVALLAVFGVGGLLLQYPIGWLADHQGSRRSAALAALVALVCCVALGSGVQPRAPLLFMLGGVLNAFLTLGLIAALGAPGVSPTRAIGAVSMAFTAAAGLGPVLLGSALQRIGAQALPWALSGVLALLLVALATTRGASDQPG